MRKKNPKRWTKYLALSFLFGVVCLVVVAIIASHFAPDFMAGLEKPPKVRAYETLQAIRQPVASDTAIAADNAEETNTLKEYWEADLPTLEERFQQFQRLMEEMHEIEESDYKELLTWFSDKKGYKDFSEEEWAQFTAFFDHNKDYLEALQAMITQGGPVFPLAVEDGPFMELPHLSRIRQMTRWLSYAATAEARRGNFDKAFDYLQSAFQCGSLVKEEPVLISYLVGIASDGIAIAHVWEAFPPGTLSPEQSNALVRLAQEHNAQPRGIDALISDAYLMLPFFERPQNYTREEVQDYLSNWNRYSGIRLQANTMVAGIYQSPFSSTLRHMNFTTMLEINQEIYALTQQPRYEIQGAYEALEARIEELPITQQLARNFLASQVRLSDAQARDEAQFDLLWMGLTLEAFHAETGHYPLFIENVIPDAPRDPFSGVPYRYELTDDGFLLYSIGMDLEDDGGQHHPRDLDIVWRGLNTPEKKAIKTARVASRK